MYGACESVCAVYARYSADVCASNFESKKKEKKKKERKKKGNTHKLKEHTDISYLNMHMCIYECVRIRGSYSYTITFKVF